jgi:hypothetical protein
MIVKREDKKPFKICSEIGELQISFLCQFSSMPKGFGFIPHYVATTPDRRGHFFDLGPWSTTIGSQPMDD